MKAMRKGPFPLIMTVVIISLLLERVDNSAADVAACSSANRQTVMISGRSTPEVREVRNPFPSVRLV